MSTKNTHQKYYKLTLMEGHMKKLRKYSLLNPLFGGEVRFSQYTSCRDGIFPQDSGLLKCLLPDW